MGLGWNPVPYDELYRLLGCCSMVLALSGTIDKPPSKVTLLTIFGHMRHPKKGLFEHVTFLVILGTHCSTLG